jgi:branched-chain amino acid transport system substrate-binding protein
MKKIFALLLVLCMIFTLAVGCSNNKTATTETATAEVETASETPVEPIKIGHICDLTGIEALTGEEAKRALEFAVESLGGEFAGRPVEIVLGDGQGQTSTAVDLARKMVEQDGVAAIFGPTQAGQKAAVAEYMKGAGVPLIFYNGTPAMLFEGNDWLVGAGGANPQMPTAMADYTYNEMGYRTVNIITMDNIGFRGFSEDYKKSFEALGGKIVQEQYAPIPCGDWGPYLATLADADAIMAWSTGSDAIALWSAWYDMGISERMPITAIIHGAFTDYFIFNGVAGNNPAAAEAMLGTVAPTQYVYDLDSPENREFVAAWTEEFGAVPQTNLPGLCYQAILLMKTAVESIDGDTAPANLIKAISETDVTGPAGRLYFEDTLAATKDVYITETVRLEDGSYNYNIIKEYKDVSPAGFGQ